MLERRIVRALRAASRRLGGEPDAERIAEMVWLAVQMRDRAGSAPSVGAGQDVPSSVTRGEDIWEEEAREQGGSALPKKLPQVPPKVPVYARGANALTGKGEEALSVRLPDAPALPNALALGRALRPLKRRVESRDRTVLDEVATAERIADADLWLPALRPAPERWLDLVLIVEEGTPSREIWQRGIREFQQLLERHGSFRSVRVWRMDARGQQLRFRAGLNEACDRVSSLRELDVSQGRRSIWILSDAVSAAWRGGPLLFALQRWARRDPVALVQLLPERMWERSVLGANVSVRLHGTLPGGRNASLTVSERPRWYRDRNAEPHIFKLPVAAFQKDALWNLAGTIAAFGHASVPGYLLAPQPAAAQPERGGVAIAPSDRVERFRRGASPLAQHLAELLALVPVSLPIARLVQKTVLRCDDPTLLAEIFLGGLLRKLPKDEGNAPGGGQYEFFDGVRPLLRDEVARGDTREVLRSVSEYIEARLGVSLHEFRAVLLGSAAAGASDLSNPRLRPFAELAIPALQRLGGRHARLATAIAAQLAPDRVEIEATAGAGAVAVGGSAGLLVALETISIEVATLEFDDQPTPPTRAERNEREFGFLTATIEFETVVVRPGFFGIGRQTEKQLRIRRSRGRGVQYVEDLGDGVVLEMVFVPGGSFMMGSPRNEAKRDSDEGPQHEVAVPAFYLGKYPVTQAQWRAVAALPRVERSLEPDPAGFKGDNRPVESLSWYDAVEFCQRIGRATGREYRLPSEAEWEYACRAGTTTPFYFGETLSTDLANYHGNYTYGDGLKGEYRRKTTPVENFPANAFGLHDMHGNVWEWCADRWHENYEGAPRDGSAWFDNDNDTSSSSDEKNQNLTYVLRGGSWYFNPRDCRSAYRSRIEPVGRDFNTGFRLACGLPRTFL